MLTLLPHPSFRYSAVELGSELIAYQKSDCLRILRCIHAKQDTNHAVFSLWRGKYDALNEYCSNVFDVFDAIFYVDRDCRRYLFPYRKGIKPRWLGNMELHDGHKGYLAKRYPAFFTKWKHFTPQLYLPGAGI